MAPSSQDSSSSRASHNYQRFIRRGNNNENRRTPRGTVHRRGCPLQIFKFNGTIHIHTAIAMMDAESFSLPPANGSFVMPTHAARPQYLRTSVGGVQTPAAERGSSRAGYHQQAQNAGHTYVPGPDIRPAPFLHTDVAGPEYPRDWRYPQPSCGLYHGGFTGVAQMDEVRPGSVTGVQTPAVGLGPAVPGPDIGPAPFLHTDVAGPEYQRIPRDWRYPQPSGGLYNGGFTSGAQMNAVWPGSVTVG